MAIEPGTVLMQIEIMLEGEDAEGYDVNTMMRVNEQCDPHEFAPVFIQCLEEIVANLKRANNRLIAREKARDN